MPAAIGAIRMAQIICDGQSSKSHAKPNTQPLSTALKAIPIGEDDELAESTLRLAREAVHEIGQVVGVQHGTSEIETNVDDATVLEAGDVLLLSVDR